LRNQKRLAASAASKIASAFTPGAILAAPDYSLTAALELCRWIKFVQGTNKSDPLSEFLQTVDQAQAVADTAKSDLDSMSEMGEMESLRLQMAMDRMSKLMSTLSNLLKKISDTCQSITQNWK
jgi:hypothetical protein